MFRNPDVFSGYFGLGTFVIPFAFFNIGWLRALSRDKSLSEANSNSLWFNHGDIIHKPRFDLRLNSGFSGSKITDDKRGALLSSDNFADCICCIRGLHAGKFTEMKVVNVL